MYILATDIYILATDIYLAIYSGDYTNSLNIGYESCVVWGAREIISNSLPPFISIEVWINMNPCGSAEEMLRWYVGGDGDDGGGGGGGGGGDGGD